MKKEDPMSLETKNQKVSEREWRKVKRRRIEGRPTVLAVLSQQPAPFLFSHLNSVSPYLFLPSFDLVTVCSVCVPLPTAYSALIIIIIIIIISISISNCSLSIFLHRPFLFLLPAHMLLGPSVDAGAFLPEPIPPCSRQLTLLYFTSGMASAHFCLFLPALPKSDSVPVWAFPWKPGSEAKRRRRKWVLSFRQLARQSNAAAVAEAGSSKNSAGSVSQSTLPSTTL